MPQACSVCTHEQRAAIDQQLIERVSLRNIAERFSVSVTALHRHKTGGHIAERLAQAQAAQEVSQADDLLAQARGLQAEAHRIKDKAETAGDLKTALAGIAQLVKIIELLARLRGELQEGATVNVVLAPEWITLRTKVVLALAPYPEARLAVAEALSDVGA